MKMKHIATSILLLLLTTLTAFAAPAGDARKSIFQLTTYNADGTVRSTGTYGAFISATGEAVSGWTPFVGAQRATVTDLTGKTYDVQTIVGANELYDVCKFTISAKTTPLTPSTHQATQGGKLSLLVPEGKKVVQKSLSVAGVEKFMDKYAYYIVTSDGNDYAAGLPLTDASGQLVGLSQKSSTSADLHSTDIAFFSTLHTTGLSANDAMYRQTGIRLQLPADKKEALLMLMMAGEQNEPEKYNGYVEDFIRQYPTEVDGYSAQAQQLINQGRFDEADNAMQTALAKATDKSEAHAEYARLMYQKLVYNPDTLYTAWTFDRAIDETHKAYDLKPDPAYRHREAQITYSKGDFTTALDLFLSLTSTPLRQNGEIFYEAAQCKTQLQAPQAEVIALLDSAVAACPQPLTVIAAPYILARGNEYDKAGQYRKALADYNVYDTLMAGRASAEFYYTRYTCELQIKQYQQALEDIAHAAVVSGRNPFYVAELASLQLRFNRFDDAIKAADLCLQAAPESTDALIIKGLALIQTQKKAEGLECLSRARDLGDERAQALIDKYK